MEAREALLGDYELRLATKDDTAFILNSWLKNFRGAHQNRIIPTRVFYFYHHKMAEDIIARGSALVVCDALDRNHILAWAIFEKQHGVLILHYFYTKKVFRGFGLGRYLLDEIIKGEAPDVVMYTHHTRDLIPVDRMLHDRGIIYNPYMLFAVSSKDWAFEDNG